MHCAYTELELIRPMYMESSVYCIAYIHVAYIHVAYIHVDVYRDLFPAN